MAFEREGDRRTRVNYRTQLVGTISVLVAAYVAPVVVEAYTTVATPDPVRALLSATLFLVVVHALVALLGGARAPPRGAGRSVALAAVAILVWLVAWVFPLVATDLGHTVTGAAEGASVGEVTLLPALIFVPLWFVWSLVDSVGRP